MDFQTLGTVLGAGAGAIFGAPMIGAGIGGGVGSAIDSGKANKIKTQRENAITTTDPNVSKFLNEINNQRLSYKTGSGASFYTDELKESASSAVEGALKLSGGSTGAAMATISGVSSGTAKGVNSILAELEKNNQFNTTLTASLVKEISQRSLEVNLAKYAQASAEAAQKETNKNNIINSLIGLGTTDGNFNVSEWIKSKSKKIDPSGISPDIVTDSNFETLT